MVRWERERGFVAPGVFLVKVGRARHENIVKVTRTDVPPMSAWKGVFTVWTVGEVT